MTETYRRRTTVSFRHDVMAQGPVRRNRVVPGKPGTPPGWRGLPLVLAIAAIQLKTDSWKSSLLGRFPSRRRLWRPRESSASRTHRELAAANARVRWAM